ncbi:MAG: cation-transporting P-type ATPase, partial [Leptolyngbyaceae cyanobacterium]
MSSNSFSSHPSYDHLSSHRSSARGNPGELNSEELDSGNWASTNWYTVSIADAIAQLQSHPQQGLSSAVAADRLQRYGANELEDRGGRSALDILKEEFEVGRLRRL